MKSHRIVPALFRLVPDVGNKETERRHQEVNLTGLNSVAACVLSCHQTADNWLLSVTRTREQLVKPGTILVPSPNNLDMRHHTPSQSSRARTVTHTHTHTNTLTHT
ncbi:hypothetical protein PoB_007561600 [Plakobranchus ocellatus]|uniref:Uncharacterized protein n=1 Tax=Plakobranchus ocellatus TaxID=259542 RepID=A0AAV4DZ44_9GAST|nr:hypothetical protein PoB_007561600 [Plakobranchus ocellatus]